MSDGDSMAISKGEGIKNYYQTKIQQLSVTLRNKKSNLRRLEAQRNELNGRGNAFCETARP